MLTGLFQDLDLTVTVPKQTAATTSSFIFDIYFLRLTTDKRDSKVLKSVSILNVHFVLVNRICVMSTPTTYMTIMMMHVMCVRSSTVNFAKGQAERV